MLVSNTIFILTRTLVVLIPGTAIREAKHLSRACKSVPDGSK